MPQHYLQFNLLTLLFLTKNLLDYKKLYFLVYHKVLYSENCFNFNDKTHQKIK